jgi:hypothetical protein
MDVAMSEISYAVILRSMLPFETELGEYLGRKTLLIDLADHGQVEDHRRDTLPRPTAFAGRKTKLSANDIKGAEHSSKVMRLEGTGSYAGVGHGSLTDCRRKRNCAFAGAKHLTFSSAAS